jgi:hypothetical protein
MLASRNSMSRWLGTGLTALALVGWCGATLSAADSASDALSRELAEVAKRVKGVCVKGNYTLVGVGDFSGGASVTGSSGPEIQTKLTTALENEGLKVVKDEFHVELEGKYEPAKEPTTGLQGVRMTVRVTQASSGDDLDKIVRFVFGAESVPRLLGLSVTTKPDDDAQTQSKKFEDALKKQEKGTPQGAIDKSIIKAADDSPYAIELLVKQDDKLVPRKAEFSARGLPFVEINKSEVYAIRLINESETEAAVALSIDGLSVFHFTESEQKPTVWLVPPGKSVTIPGWHKTDSVSVEFKVTDFPDSAANKVNLKPSSTIGTVTATFSAAFPPGDLPPGEPNLKDTRGTGFGADLEFKTEHVQRQIGNPRATVSVRYERE